MLIKKKSLSHLILSLLFLTVLPSSLCAESFRVRKTAVLSLESIRNQDGTIDTNASSTVNAGINDAIFIKLPEDLTFIQGIELNIKIPSIVTKCPNTIIYSIYENVSPFPSEKTIDYTGKELYTSVYPGLVSLTIQIPLIRGNTIQKTPYADKTLIPEHSRNFVFIRNQLAMKGVPQEINSAQFVITAKPILINKDRLVIRTKNKPSDLTVIVDDKQVELDKNNSCYLKPGVRNVTISAASARTENRSCIIEVGKNSFLDIDFQSTAPQVFISMPQGTHVTVDNQAADVKNGTLSLAPGEHTLKFSLGGYEIVKQLTIIEGRNYSVDVKLDADVIEN
ncbi:carboxypeptidase-like regulatory domain-containing protein [Treponema sp.]|uniref:carboxypeptidase-like regulatory domain-containing protein n=1 Tax=Treponema sp. TaxID=166 RepID=UPI00388E3252